MDATISTDKVTAAIGALPSLDPCPNAVNIRALRVHIEQALQLLPCPQSVHHGWKGLAMSRTMYTLLVTGGTPFRAPTDPGTQINTNIKFGDMSAISSYIIKD
jgi:hypothetical protein